jgi:hypothetical protein
MQQPGFLETTWEGEPRLLPSGRMPPKGNVTHGVCRTWQDLTGDSGWAGVVAEATLADPNRPVYLISDLGSDALALFAEAMALLPQEYRWAVLFSTYYATVPQGMTCHWRWLVRGSAEVKAAQKIPNALVLDLNPGMGQAEGGGLVEAARTGQTPPQLALPKAVKAAAVHGWPDDLDSDESARRGGALSPGRRAQTANAPPPVPASPWGGQSTSIGRPVYGKSGWIRGFVSGIAAGVLLTSGIGTVAWLAFGSSRDVSSIAQNDTRVMRPEATLKNASSSGSAPKETAPDSKSPTKPTDSTLDKPKPSGASPDASGPSPGNNPDTNRTVTSNGAPNPPTNPMPTITPPGANAGGNPGTLPKNGQPHKAPIRSNLVRYSFPLKHNSEASLDLNAECKLSGMNHSLTIRGLNTATELSDNGKKYGSKLVAENLDLQTVRVYVQHQNGDKPGPDEGLIKFRTVGTKLHSNPEAQANNEEGRAGLTELSNCVLELGSAQVWLSLRQPAHISPINLELSQKESAVGDEDPLEFNSKPLNWTIRPESRLVFDVDKLRASLILKTDKADHTAKFVPSDQQKELRFESVVNSDWEIIIPRELGTGKDNKTDKKDNKTRIIKAVLNSTEFPKLQAQISELSRIEKLTKSQEEQLSGLKKKRDRIKADKSHLANSKPQIQIPSGVVCMVVDGLEVPIYEIGP